MPRGRLSLIVEGERTGSTGWGGFSQSPPSYAGQNVQFTLCTLGFLHLYALTVHVILVHVYNRHINIVQRFCTTCTCVQIEKTGRKKRSLGVFCGYGARIGKDFLWCNGVECSCHSLHALTVYPMMILIGFQMTCTKTKGKNSFTSHLKYDFVVSQW